ncbi:MAG: hypothetical protein V3U98_05845 [Acidobacteriota bacterium]
MNPAAPTLPGVSPLAATILSGQAPTPARLAAARGALPVTRPERLLLCLKLREDTDASVRKAAEERLAGEARADFAAALEADELLAPPVLDYFAQCGGLEPDVLERLVAIPEISDTALEHLASCPHVAVLERILINQTRLLSNAKIVHRLDANTDLSPDARRLLMQFKQDFWKRGSQKVVLTRPAEEQAAEAEIPVSEEQALAATESAAPELTPEESSDEAFQAAHVRIMQLTVPEKINLCVKANKEERTILIRDSNKMVASTVLKSPKINDQELEMIANMRNVSDDILRQIAINKNWTRKYSIAHSLVRNPKTPVGLSLPFLNRLNNKDIKNLVGDKNISDTLRKLAKRVVDQRSQKMKTFKRK